MFNSRDGRISDENRDLEHAATNHPFTVSPRSMSREAKYTRISPAEEWEDRRWDDEESGRTHEARQTTRRKRGSGSIGDGMTEDQERTPKQERKLADLNVLKRSAINVLLIGLWYFFSLSISIVSRLVAWPGTRGEGRSVLIYRSTTSGCSQKTTWTFISPCSRRACTWWCSSRWHASCCSSCRDFGLAMMASRTRTSARGRIRRTGRNRS